VGEPFFTSLSESGHKHNSTRLQGTVLDSVATVLEAPLAPQPKVQARGPYSQDLGTESEFVSSQRIVED